MSESTMTWHEDGHSFCVTIDKSVAMPTMFHCPNRVDETSACMHDGDCVVERFMDVYGLECNVGVSEVSGPVEIAWTIIPLLIVFVLTLTTVRTIRAIELTEAPEGALQVVVIGHQWWWEYRYLDASFPGGEVVVANELHVPINRPVWLRLESADVIHSWWVPALAGKMDVIPNHTNHTWFNAEKEGLYLGQCAEYCGNQHAGMLLRVIASKPADFDAWLQTQIAPTVNDTSVAMGRDIFQEYACSNCHTVKGVSDGQFAPDLTHLMSRQTIASGVAPLDPTTLRAWIENPQALKPGCNMPSLQLDTQELDAVTAYLLTLR
jgi:cytochrome c oxidase subunit 2